MTETQDQLDYRIGVVLGTAERLGVSFALAERLGEEESSDLWSDRFYDVLHVGLGATGDAARAIALLLAEKGWYQREADRLLSVLETGEVPS